jgi:hypothetical protein
MKGAAGCRRTSPSFQEAKVIFEVQFLFSLAWILLSISVPFIIIAGIVQPSIDCLPRL